MNFQQLGPAEIAGLVFLAVGLLTGSLLLQGFPLFCLPRHSACGPEVEHEPMMAKPFLGIALSSVPPFLDGIHEATIQGDISKLESLLREGRSVHEGLHNGISPLHLGAAAGRIEASSLLISRGARLDDRCLHGLSPLILAIHRNQHEMVEFLLSQGARVNQPDDLGRTPLHWAAAADQGGLNWTTRPNLLKILLRRGADPDREDHQGFCAAQLAQALDKDDVAEWLKELSDRDFHPQRNS